MHAVARIAQLVEQRIENPRVPGSIPGSGTTFNFKVLRRLRKLQGSTVQVWWNW